MFEPGRSLIASCSVLVCKVLGIKENDGSGVDYAVVDAAMTDLIRPALYGAYHQVVPCHAGTGVDICCWLIEHSF